MVLGSELLVDWCKHAFVTKFNHIRPSVYGRFMDVLCLDFVKDGKEVSPPKTEIDSRLLSTRVQQSHEGWVFPPFLLFVLH
jgi:Eukaryotic membrane protein family